MRTSCPWRIQSELHLLDDVAALIARRDDSGAELQQLLPRKLTSVLDLDTWAIELGSRILSPTTGICQSTRCRSSPGQLCRVLLGKPGNRLVHVLV